jgi:CBS domain-containing protein
MYEFLKYRVQDVMSSPVVVKADATLGEVEMVLEKNGFNALPVVDDEAHLVGIVTSLDLLKAFAFGEGSILPAYEDIMRKPITGILTSEPLTVPPRQDLTRTLEKMVATRNKSFPVVDDDGRLVGVVAREDVMRALRRADTGERPSS